jgi:hypothetical protein
VAIILTSTSRNRENLKGWARLFMQRSPGDIDPPRDHATH